VAGKGRKLRELVLPLSVKVGDQTVNFEYVIGKIDHEWERDMNVAQGPTGSFWQVCDVLCRVVPKWNWTEDYVPVSEGELEKMEDEDIPVLNGYRLAEDRDYEDSGAAKDHVETRRVPLDPDEIEFAKVPTPVIGQILGKLQQDANQGGAQAKKG